MVRLKRSLICWALRRPCAGVRKEAEKNVLNVPVAPVHDRVETDLERQLLVSRVLAEPGEKPAHHRGGDPVVAVAEVGDRVLELVEFRREVREERPGVDGPAGEVIQYSLGVETADLGLHCRDDLPVTSPPPSS